MHKFVVNVPFDWMGMLIAEDLGKAERSVGSLIQNDLNGDPVYAQALFVERDPASDKTDWVRWWMWDEETDYVHSNDRNHASGVITLRSLQQGTRTEVEADGATFDFIPARLPS